MKIRGRLIRIEARHFVAGIELYVGPKMENRCAPILHYMKDWSAGDIVRYCFRKGWKITTYKEDE